MMETVRSKGTWTGPTELAKTTAARSAADNPIMAARKRENLIDAVERASPFLAAALSSVWDAFNEITFPESLLKPKKFPMGKNVYRYSTSSGPIRAISQFQVLAAIRFPGPPVEPCFRKRYSWYIKITH
ncbi:hypothetical protein [Paenibacillus sp. 32O-W]|uniref:hypothetical protein n=1 Tax=Paenibacillus sp. 32O-W TaxID=1695218 RepID=UPI001F213FD1|nr:hypothetical protein [Paenibacillus sp. 32O-W]